MSRDGNSRSTASLTRESLIRLELTGKKKAIASYDSILWKIRSGYAVVLYGALSFIAKTGGANTKGVVIGVLIAGFSIFAGLLDWSFLRCKLRVVGATDKLADIAMKIATEQALTECEERQLLELLHNSGEPRANKVDWRKYDALVPLFALYVGTSVIGIIALVLIHFM